ncbi:MAG TPA: hypothetical protein VFZ93_04825 [Albitalea sp.]
MRRITSTLALAGLLALAPFGASATTISECQGLITTLSTTTEAAEFLGRNAAKDEAGLLGKLREASDKLDRAKTGDAAQKVDDYQRKLVELVNAGKISQETFAALSAGAAGVQTCIAGIS